VQPTITEKGHDEQPRPLVRDLRAGHGSRTNGGYGFIVLAVDTEGNMFGLHSLA
jgi:hypothetical protein